MIRVGEFPSFTSRRRSGYASSPAFRFPNWDVIHFNMGLHDLKRVTEAGTSQKWNNPDDPYQADLATCRQNLEQVIAQLKGTGAEPIFATTTPFPLGVRPYRDPVNVPKYNAV